MRTKYNDFVKINEEGVFDALKGLFNQMFKNMSDEIKKPIEDLTSKLDKTKKPEEMKKIITDYLKIHREGLVKSVNESDSLKTLVTSVNENLTAIYACIDSSIKHLGEQKYSFEELFKNSPEGVKKLFSKDEKGFNKRVDEFSKQLVIDTGKQFKITKEDVLNDFIKEVKINQVNQINKAENTNKQQATTTPTNGTEQTPTTGNEQQQTKENNSIEYPMNDKIFEADVPVNTPPTGTNTTNTSKISDDTFKKLKDMVVSWFDKTLYKSVNDNLIKSQGVTAPATGLSAQDEIKNLKSQTNKDSVKKLIDTVVALDDPKKYAELRDYITKNFGIKPEDIGKF
jgi:hypothetical protein